LRGVFSVFRCVHSSQFCGRRCGVSVVCAMRILAWALTFHCDAPSVSVLSFPLWSAGGSAAVGRTQCWGRLFLSVETAPEWGGLYYVHVFSGELGRPLPRRPLLLFGVLVTAVRPGTSAPKPYGFCHAASWRPTGAALRCGNHARPRGNCFARPARPVPSPGRGAGRA